MVLNLTLVNVSITNVAALLPTPIAVYIGPDLTVHTELREFYLAETEAAPMLALGLGLQDDAYGSLWMPAVSHGFNDTIELSEDSTVTVKRTTVEDNTMPGKGYSTPFHVVYFASHWEDVLFQRNLGYQGGAVTISGALHATFIRCTFVENIAQFSGGAVELRALGGALYSIVDSVFLRNAALNDDAHWIGQFPVVVQINTVVNGIPM